MHQSLVEVYAERGLSVPEAVARLFDSEYAERLGDLLLRPEGVPLHATETIEGAEATIADSEWPLLPNLVPVLPLDGSSFARVVASGVEGPVLPGEGAVMHWHLDLDDDTRRAPRYGLLRLHTVSRRGACASRGGSFASPRRDRTCLSGELPCS
jgi:hypothetical protein